MKPFEEYLTAAVGATAPTPRELPPGECQTPKGIRCSLCHASTLAYPAELQIKNKALQAFWKSLRLGFTLDPLVPSPQGRNYRTTSKRRAFALRDGVRLGLIRSDERGEVKPFPVVHCAIEPEAHAAIYALVQETLTKPYAKRLAKQLSYVIIKGNYVEQTVIFNVREINTDVIKAANTLSKSLTHHRPSVIGVFLYEDDSSPQYYMGTKDEKRMPKFKKLYGKQELFQRVMGKSFLYSPLSFAQVNQSILETVIERAASLLKLDGNATLYDLYCGYGLFALTLAEKVKAVIAAEASAASIDSAIGNARRQKASHVRFIRNDIDGESIEHIMQTCTERDAVLLDPPRKGTSSGVIECIAAKRPRSVLHIFCDIDLLPKELKRWEKSGYKAVRAIPFDMFPGTASVETMVLLYPSVA